ncbi:hypothetical protein A5784_16965 [Mycobacterium sp. 852013-50091_SCH5140682]|nr:hypothetical protein A5784_16965 [Mycobacterium sp. 852013-50091_SCH5140682]
MSAALHALVASAMIAVTGVLLRELQIIGVAYFGAACAASFATGPHYRGRLLALLAQGLGAAGGIAAGSLLPHSAVSLVLTAAAAGMVSGLVGGVGPNAPAFGVMLSIGVAFGQFGGSTLPWWQQCAWYLAGTLAVGVTTLGLWPFRRHQSEREAAAEVLTRAAELCAAVGTDDARRARTRLAAASATARTVGHFPAAELTAFAAAGLYAEGREVAPEVIHAIRDAAEQTRRGQPVRVNFDGVDVSRHGDPHLYALADALSPQPSRPPASPPRRLASVLRFLSTRTAMANGARIGLCLAVATGVAVLLKRPGDHALWLPLTAAVVVRPEYASVFMRSVNRVGGTVVGAVLAALVLWAQLPALVVAVAAASGLALAVLTAPRLYAFYVTGVTTSTLLSASLGHAAMTMPIVRVADTLLGATLALVFGYLLWPGARRLPATARLDVALDAAAHYLDEATKPPSRRVHWQARRDDAYRLAHQVRAAAELAVTEPPPVSGAALRVLPLAGRLEDLVDTITAIGSRADAGSDTAVECAYTRTALEDLRQQSAHLRSSRTDS